MAGKPSEAARRAAETVLRPLGLKLVRVEDRSERQGRLATPTPPPLPPGAAEHLRPENPELVDLRQRYAHHPATTSSVWSDGYLANELTLQYFRADNVFVWQTQDGAVLEADGALRPAPSAEINYLLSGYYIRSADKDGLLDRLGDDDAFGNVLVPFDKPKFVSRDLLDSVLELSFLERQLGISRLSSPNVLDIGAGYGRFAYRLTQGVPGIGRVYCVDAVPESTFVCSYYLQFRGVEEKVETVPLDLVEERMSGVTVDLVTNIHSFSECPLAAITWWLDLIASMKVPNVLIIPNTGEQLLSAERDGTRLDFAPALRERGYEQTALEPKYGSPGVQRHGLFPTYYHLYRLGPRG